jgi:aspartokinase/homoserine dehydrogenase 1
MKILKFGGSSLSTPDAVRGVGAIILDAQRREPVIVVVSAFQGVTNELLGAALLAERSHGAYRKAFDDLARRHRSMTAALVGSGRTRARASVEALLAELSSTLQGIHLLRHCPLRALDMTASFGERLSAVIVAAHLNRRHPSTFVDARDILVTDDQFTHANVNFKRTNLRARAVFKRLMRQRGGQVIPVVTGFIGATEAGHTTTIGRNGSDYSAAIVGAAVNASAIEIWTDVDGVLSADPRIVPAAFVLPRLTYEEAMELSYFGAKVLHSATMAPAVAKRIPILIKNTFRPSAAGTVISTRAEDNDRPVKGITSVGDLSLLTLRGPGMVGMPGVADRVFRALAARAVNVVLISQASSEHTICLGLRSADAVDAVAAVGQEFRFEIGERLMHVDRRDDQAILAVVGEGMKGRPGVAGKLFASLGQQHINISAIAQGASERNISCVIDAAQQERALKAIHRAFFDAGPERHVARRNGRRKDIERSRLGK